MSKYISTKLPQSIPLLHEAEIMVIGGGPGGLGAAIAAAREGRDVILIEHYGFLGGMATAGEVNPFMPNGYRHESKSFDVGIFTDWLQRIHSYDSSRNQDNFDPSLRVFDPFHARLAAEELCLEAGVKLLYHHRVAHVDRQGSHITNIVLHSKSGLTAAKANIYIDSTGDGDCAALAGAPFKMGGESSQHVQPMTLCFKLKLDPKLNASMEDIYKIKKVMDKKFQQAQKEGTISNPRQDILLFPSTDENVVHFNSTRIIHKSAISGTELSEAEIEGRKQFKELFNFLRNEIPIFKNSEIYSIATQIGVRESRRVLGKIYLTREDYNNCKSFPDGICQVDYPIDIHNPNGSGTEMTRLPKGGWLEIPYRCLINNEIDNLIIGSRCISVDHAVHSSIRVMPPVCSIGQAAGTAAAMALEENSNVWQVDGTLLKERLIQRGRNLEPYDAKRVWKVSNEEKKELTVERFKKEQPFSV